MSKILSDNPEFRENFMKRVSFWRTYPHVFVKELLRIKLALPQAMSLKMMNDYNLHVFIASRGYGKTFVTACYVVFRAICYPGSKIVLASGTVAQANLVIRVIQRELMDMSKLLGREIKDITMSNDSGNITFENGSTIDAVASRDSARGNRSDVLICDEFRIIEKLIHDQVLFPINSESRNPKCVRKDKYKHLRNEIPSKFIYMSSGWYEYHWAYKQLYDAVGQFISDDKVGSAISIPYQFAIKDNISNKDYFQSAFERIGEDESSWAMEYQAKFFNQKEGATFKQEDLNKFRTIYKPLYTSEQLKNIGVKELDKIPKSEDGFNVISCDPAFVGGDDRDRTSITITSVTPNINEDNPGNSRYIRDVVYLEVNEGGSAKQTAKRIRELFYEFDCDYIVLDRANMGLEIYYDLGNATNTGDFYCPGFASMNEKKLEKRNQELNPLVESKIYTIYADESFNLTAFDSLSSNINNKKVRFPASNVDAEKYFMETIPTFGDMNRSQRNDLLKPFFEANNLMYELGSIEIKLNGSRRHITYTSKRNDMYTSLTYSNYFIEEKETEFLKDLVRRKHNPNKMYGFYS